MKNLPFNICHLTSNFNLKIEKLKNHWKLENGNWKMLKVSGFTLIEILVVVAIFSFLGILITRSVLLTIGGSKKSEAIVKVKENLDYATGVIERQIRNADSIPQCPNSNPAILNYIDQDGNAGSFSCLTDANGNGYIASGSAQLPLTASDINVTACYLSCNVSGSTSPPTVTINLEAVEASASAIQNADVTVSTQVSLRNY